MPFQYDIHASWRTLYISKILNVQCSMSIPQSKDKPTTSWVIHSFTHMIYSFMNLCGVIEHLKLLPNLRWFWYRTQAQIAWHLKLQKMWHLNHWKNNKKHASHNHLMAFGIHNINRGLTPRLSAWWANVEPSASAFAKLQTPQVSQKQDSLSCIMRSYQLLADPTIRDQLLVIFFLIWKDDVHCTMPSDWLRADSSAWAMVAKPWRIWYGKHDDSRANIYRPSKINQNHQNIAFWHQLSSLRWLEGLKINSVNS